MPRYSVNTQSLQYNLVVNVMSQPSFKNAWAMVVSFVVNRRLGITNFGDIEIESERPVAFIKVGGKLYRLYESGAKQVHAKLRQKGQRCWFDAALARAYESAVLPTVQGLVSRMTRSINKEILTTKHT